MTDDGLKCSKQICKPAEDSFEKVWIEMKGKASVKILLAILIPVFLLIAGSIRSNYVSFTTQNTTMTQKVFDKLTEVNRNIEKFSAQLESIKALGDRDSANNRQRIERLENWKEKQK